MSMNYRMTNVRHVAVFSVTDESLGGVRLFSRMFTSHYDEYKSDFRERVEKAIEAEFRDVKLNRDLLIIPSPEAMPIISGILV